MRGGVFVLWGCWRIEGEMARLPWSLTRGEARPNYASVHRDERLTATTTPQHRAIGTA
jgi:hypothetical protein